MINEKSYKYILLYCIVYITPNSVKPLHLIINKIKGYIEEYSRKKYLTLVDTNENKVALKIYEVLGKKIKDLIRSINNNSDDYDEKYMKNKFSSRIA